MLFVEQEEMWQSELVGRQCQQHPREIRTPCKAFPCWGSPSQCLDPTLSVALLCVPFRHSPLPDA